MYEPSTLRQFNNTNTSDVVKTLMVETETKAKTWKKFETKTWKNFWDRARNSVSLFETETWLRDPRF